MLNPNKKEHSELNEGIGEGVAFRGRLVIAFHVDLIDSSSDESSLQDIEDEVEPRNIQQLSENGLGRVEEFFLFSTFLEASMIDKKGAEKPISFEISMGNYGNVVDGRNESMKKKGGYDDDDDESDTKSLLSRSMAGSMQSLSAEQTAVCKSVTPSMRPLTNDKLYYHKPFNER